MATCIAVGSVIALALFVVFEEFMANRRKKQNVRKNTRTP